MFISYRELIPKEEYPYMKDNLQSERYDNQDKIVFFLRSGKVLFARQGHQQDVFTGERLKDDTVIMTSGDYLWPSTLAYYVEKYNLRLPKEFEDFVLKGMIN